MKQHFNHRAIGAITVIVYSLLMFKESPSDSRLMLLLLGFFFLFISRDTVKRHTISAGVIVAISTFLLLRFYGLESGRLAIENFFMNGSNVFFIWVLTLFAYYMNYREDTENKKLIEDEIKEL